MVAPLIFGPPDDCTPPAIGTERVGVEGSLNLGPIPAWTLSNPGQWLHDQIVGAGFAGPLDAGSAWVLMHGADGVVFAWLGPPDAIGELDLQAADGVESAEIAPLVPFQRGAYRPAVVDSVVAGGVRLWLLTHPRDQYEWINFPGLTTAPCLPSQSEIRESLLRIATAANADPHDGALPTDAGRFAINSDVGISVTDPGDRHLIQVAERALGRPVTTPGYGTATLDGATGDQWLFTQIPPLDTDTVTLAAQEAGRYPPPSYPRTIAGGLSLQLRIQPPDDAALTDVTRIAAELNRDPFLGQPASEDDWSRG